MLRTGLILSVVAASALAAEQSAPKPVFQNIRSEDNPETRQASLYHTALPGAQGAELTVGGQARARGEAWKNFGFRPENDDEFGLIRLRLHGDLRVCPNFRLYAEGISATAHGRSLPPKGGKRPVDEDDLDLLNAFGDVSGTLGPVESTLRVGRQELQYGKQRLISPLDWVNTRRTFEGARLLNRYGDWKVDAFATRFVAVQKYEFNDGDSGQNFYGAYAARKAAAGVPGLDVYALGLDKESARFAASTNALGEDRYTLGARTFGTCGATAWDYDLEGGYQFGSFGDDDISAWFAAAETGYSVPECPFKTRWSLGLDYASGDCDPDDGELNTFNQLYPLGHAYFGGIDAVGRQNIFDASLAVKGTLAKGLDSRIEFHNFWKAQEEDGLYDAAGNLSPAGAGRDDGIGQELDVVVDYALDVHTKLSLGYGHFFAGDAIVTDEDIDFGYASVQLTF